MDKLVFLLAVGRITNLPRDCEVWNGYALRLAYTKSSLQQEILCSILSVSTPILNQYLSQIRFLNGYNLGPWRQTNCHPLVIRWIGIVQIGQIIDPCGG